MHRIRENIPSPCVYRTILVLEGQWMWSPMAGSSACLMPDRTRDRTALLRDITVTATGNFDSLQQSSSHGRRCVSGRKAARTHTPELTACHGSSGWSPASHRGSQVQFQAGPCGICGGQIRIKFFFLKYFSFPLSASFHQSPTFIPPTVYGDSK